MAQRRAPLAKAFSFPPSSSFSIPSLAFLRISALAYEKESGQWPFREKNLSTARLLLLVRGVERVEMFPVDPRLCLLIPAKKAQMVVGCLPYLELFGLGVIFCFSWFFFFWLITS
jgi:hypothetical protein